MLMVSAARLNMEEASKALLEARVMPSTSSLSWSGTYDALSSLMGPARAPCNLHYPPEMNYPYTDYSLSIESSPVQG